MNFKILSFQSPVFIFFVLWIMGCSNVESRFKKCQDEGYCGPVLEVKRVSKSLPQSPNDPAWQVKEEIKKLTIELGPQLITNPQWPNPAVKQVSVSALRSQHEICIRLEWEDDSNELATSYSDDYIDKAAVMFPIYPGDDIPPITMGAEGEPVNIWQWKASLEKPLKKSLFPGSTPLSKTVVQDDNMETDIKKSPVEDLNAEGFSTLTYQENQNVRGKGVWKNKTWRVMFRRSLSDDDSRDAQITGSIPMAVAVWNGSNKERNGQKGLSNWILLKFI